MRLPDLSEFDPVQARRLTSPAMIADGGVFTVGDPQPDGSVTVADRRIPPDATVLVWTPRRLLPLPYATRKATP